MKNNLKLVFSLLLLVSFNCVTALVMDNKAKVKNLTAEMTFAQNILMIAERKKLKLDKKPLEELTDKEKHALVEKLSLKQKETILEGDIENLFDENNKDNFAFHADCLAYLFNKNQTKKEYKELAAFLQANRNCNKILTFVFKVMPELQKKTPKELATKVQEIVKRNGIENVRKVVTAKLQ